MVDDDIESFIYPLPWKWITSLIAALNFIAFFGCLLFLISMLTSKKGIIYNAYNIYIFFLILPDAFMTLMRGIQELIITIKDGRKFPPYFFNAMMGCWFFYFTSNLYLNAILTYEINILIRRSYQRIEAQPPKLRRVLTQIVSVYFFALLCALWVALDIPWSPIDIYDGQRGVYSLGSPKNNDGSALISELASYIIAFVTLTIPIIYVITIRILIWKNRLLPKSGRTRVLSLFFMRIIVVFLAFYLPNTIITALLTEKRSMVVYFWGKKITGFLTSLQAIVTLYMVSGKEDVWQVVANNLQKSLARSRNFFRGSTLSVFSASNDTFRTNDIIREGNNEITNKKTSQWDEEDIYDGDSVARK